MDEKVKRSSKKVFEGSAPKEFYGEGYFLHGVGSNYGSKDADGKDIFVPYLPEQF